MRAAADVEIEVTYVRGQHERVATITKLKDGDDNIELGFKLVGVNLGLDEDGEPITSCVVAPTGDGGVVPRAGPKVRLGEKEELVMRVLSTLEEFGGGDIKAEHLKKAVVEQSVCTNPARDTREQTAGRSINQLVEKNVLRFENGFVKRV